MGKKKTKTQSQPGRKVVTRNKQAFRNYFISDRMEAGLVLLGSEVKSLRDGRVNLGDAYAEVRAGEVFLVKCHISPFPQASYNNHEPLRERKLLLHKREIHKLGIKLNERGFTLVPLEIYFREGRAKIELGLGKGKKLHDKRESVRDRDIKRDMERGQ
jgi:SsrA-binding protein